MKRVFLSAAACLLLLTSPASAEPSASTAAPTPAPVYCGSYTPFYFRVNAAGKTAEARALAAMDVINKYLGGKVGKVTTRVDPKTKLVRLLLNNEVVAVITPQDAAVERVKTPAQLAAKWTKLLSIAFDASKAQPG